MCKLSITNPANGHGQEVNQESIFLTVRRSLRQGLYRWPHGGVRSEAPGHCEWNFRFCTKARQYILSGSTQASNPWPFSIPRGWPFELLLCHYYKLAVAKALYGYCWPTMVCTAPRWSYLHAKMLLITVLRNILSTRSNVVDNLYIQYPSAEAQSFHYSETPFPQKTRQVNDWSFYAILLLAPTMFSFLKNKHYGVYEYAHVEQEPLVLEKSNHAGFECKTQGSPKFRCFPSLFWQSSTFVFAMISLFLVLFRRSPNQLGTYETGFTTDFSEFATYLTLNGRGWATSSWSTSTGQARSAVELERRKFTGTPRFDENGTALVPESVYVGAPSPETDRAWKDIGAGRIQNPRFLSTKEDLLMMHRPKYLVSCHRRRGFRSLGSFV